jgi:hypothetical protein
VVNLVNFKVNNMLRTNLPGHLRCSSISLTFEYLILTIDGFGVLLYQVDNLSEIVGVLALGNSKWQVSCNQNGSVVLVASDEQGRSWASIYKATRR